MGAYECEQGGEGANLVLYLLENEAQQTSPSSCIYATTMTLIEAAKAVIAIAAGTEHTSLTIPLLSSI